MSSLTTKLDHVKTSRNMIEFLAKYVDWDVQLFSTDDDKNFDSKQNSSNSFSSKYCKVNAYNFHNFVNILQLYYTVFVVLGLISLLGNGVTITHHARNFFKRKNTKTKESTVYDMMVFNLCFADLLNAVYLIVYPIAIAKLTNISKSLCDGLGVISALSIQSSVSFLVIITGYRLYGVLYPYKSIRIRTVAALLVLVWLVWLVVVSLPLFNVILFVHAFTYGIETAKNRCLVSFDEIALFVNLLADSINSAQVPFGLVLNNVKNYTNSKELVLQISNSFNLIDDDEFRGFEYYNVIRGCSIETYISDTTANSHFSFSLLAFNLAAFLFIIIAHIIILKNISSLGFKDLLPLALQKKYFKHGDKESPKVKSENKQIYIRVLVIVITDLICGIPACLVGLMYYVGNLKNNCFPYDHLNFAENIAPLLSLILFPLNSVINPYIYSFHLWKDLFSSCKQEVQKFT